MALYEGTPNKSFNVDAELINSEQASITDELSIPHFSQISNLPSGLSNQYAIAMVDDLEKLYYTQNSGTDWQPVSDTDVVGIEWNITQDSWRHIDLQGDTLNLDPLDFADIEPFKSITRVNLSPTGEINAYYGDDNYTEDGSNGRVMVQFPRSYRKVEIVTEGGDVKVRKFIAEAPLPDFKNFWCFNQRTDSPPADFVYVAAYEGDFVYDASNTQYEIHSRSGKQPWTGGQIWEVDIDNLTNEPSIGDEVSTPNDSGWYVVDVDWTNATMWVRKPGDDSLDWTDNDTITNDTQSNTVADCEFSTGSKDNLHFDIEEARQYAENIGSYWGLFNYHTYSMIQFMFSIIYGNMDSQTELGRGIVDKAGGTGFAGELTGADSINSNLNSLLIGSGSGTDGYTPITFLGIENLWGNGWTFVDGYEAVDSEYRILDTAGDWSNVGPSAWTSSDYETSETSPLTDDEGYISDIETEELLKYGFIPSETAGSSSEYIPDTFYSHDSAENNILRAKGGWATGSDAGAGHLSSNYGVGFSNRFFGARLEFIK